MQLMDGNGSSHSQRLKERLAGLLRSASLRRSPCSTSSSTTASSTAMTNPPTSTNSSSRALLTGAKSFSEALDHLHRLSTPPPPPTRFSLYTPPPEKKKKQRSSSHHAHHHRFVAFKNAMGVKLASNPYGFSTSDDDTDEGDNSIEVFFSSSRTFSSDDSDFYYTSKNSKKKKRPPRLRRRRRRTSPGCCVSTCGVSEGLRPAVEGPVRRGLAVVKRSRDPYGDFQASMVEMIVERQVFGVAELEQLLRSYLFLNAAHHHPVILRAFSDILVVLHGG